MPRVERSITILAPPAAVFDYVAGFEHDDKWRSGVIEMRMVGEGGGGGPVGVGAEHVEVRQVPGRRIETRSVITAYDPPSLVRFQRASGPVRPVGEYRIDAEGGRCRFTCAIEVPLSGALRLLGPVVSLALRVVVARSLPGDLQRLKALLEPASGASGSD